MKRPWWQRILFYGLAAVALAATWQGVRAVQQHAEQRTLEAKPPGDGALPQVVVAPVELSPAVRVVKLLGEARPWLATTVYAKVSGYLKDIRVDRGSMVKAGDIMAVLDVPELDQQLKAARADANNRVSLAARAQKLAGPGIVSEQEADTARSAAAVAGAQVAGLVSQRDYRNVRAPFDGMVTVRYADPGALLQAATAAQTGALPVAKVEDLSKLRVTVYLTQDDAAAVHLGDEVTVSAPNRPESTISAKVARTSGELDTRSRTLLVEIDVDNRDGRFAPGSCLDVAWTAQQAAQPQVPSEALIVRGPQTWVAVVSADGRLQLRPVRVLASDGAKARVVGELKPGEWVVVASGDELIDGVHVRPVKPAAKDGKK